jgi:hypothetical protein
MLTTEALIAQLPTKSAPPAQAMGGMGGMGMGM